MKNEDSIVDSILDSLLLLLSTDVHTFDSSCSCSVVYPSLFPSHQFFKLFAIQTNQRQTVFAQLDEGEEHLMIKCISFSNLMETGKLP